MGSSAAATDPVARKCNDQGPVATAKKSTAAYELTPSQNRAASEYELTDAEMQDIKAIASRDGTTVDEALKANGWQTRYIEIVEKLQARYPNDFSGSKRNNNGAGIWVAFKHGIPNDDELDELKSLPADVTIQGNRGFSEQDLREATDVAHRSTMRLNGIRDATTSYNLRSGIVTVCVELSEPTSQTQSEIEAALDQAQELNGISLEVKIVEYAGGNPQDDAMRGGGLINRGQDTLLCTAGFTLIHPTGLRRIGTLGGDSGGPWFWGGRAYGIHYGFVNDRSSFTPVFQFAHGNSFRVDTQ